MLDCSYFSLDVRDPAMETGLNERINSIIIFSIESICLFELLRSFQIPYRHHSYYSLYSGILDWPITIEIRWPFILGGSL
jgi:hypothetical protein